MLKLEFFNFYHFFIRLTKNNGLCESAESHSHIEKKLSKEFLKLNNPNLK